MSWLWPIKTGQTFFDTWSICHVCFWLVYGYNFVAVCLKYKWTVSLELGVLLALVCAYVWECFEGFYLEPRGWVMFQEIWFNRWVSDPLMAIIGAMIGIVLAKRQ